MDAFNDAVSWLNGYFWNFLIIPLLVIAGVYFTVRTMGVQVRLIPEMFRTLRENPASVEEGEGISAFRAFCVSAASRVGTGNVAGVAIAISLGGPGAVFWMWLLALVGGATAFVESTLAQLYKRDGESAYIGGPAYYIRDGLRQPWLAVAFAVCITLTYGFVFNAVQANSISASVQANLGGGTLTAWAVGIILALLTGLVIFGGIRRLSAVTEVLVPLMAGAYVAVALLVMILNIQHVPAVIGQIVGSALGLQEVAGATVGAAIMNGMKRGLFSNEAGMGSVPNAAATAAVSHPAKQGLVQTLGVYFDTLLVCSATAFIILLSEPEFGGDVDGISLTQSALQEQVGSWAGPFISIVIFFLAFSSILGNSYYGETNIQFLREHSHKTLVAFRVLVMLAVLGGSLGSVALVWNLADLFMGTMATINLIALIPLGGLAMALLKNYQDDLKRGQNPVFHRDELTQAPNVSVWDGSDELTNPEVANKLR